MNLAQIAKKLRSAAEVLEDLIGIDRPTTRETPKVAEKIRTALAKGRANGNAKSKKNINPKTGEPYKLSAKTRARMRRAQQARAKGNLRLVKIS